VTGNYDVFISHAVGDTATARRLAEHLSSHDLRVFLDVDSIRIGDDWQGIISDALESSSAIAVLLSSRTNIGGYASQEISYASANARDGRTLLIPIYLDEQSAHNVPRNLEKFQGIQVHDSSELGPAAQKIAKAVRDAQPSSLVHVKATGNIPQQPPGYVSTSTVSDIIRVVESSLAQATGPVQIIGQAGIGKTTAVAEACRRLQNRFSLIRWLRSGSSEDVIDDLVTLGNSLEIDDGQSSVMHEYASATVRYLESTTMTWCLVFDEASAAEDLSRWIPGSTEFGTSIVISRHQLPWIHGGLSHSIGALDTEESARYLQAQLSTIADQSLDDETLMSIAENLGGSPLLLTLTGRYLAQSDDPAIEQAGRFLELVRDSPPSLENSIERSLSQIGASTPVAITIFYALGWLADAPFPLDAILRAAQDPYLSSTEGQVGNAVEALRVAGLINIDQGQIEVHDLVRHFARGRSGPPAMAFLLRSIKRFLDEPSDAPQKSAAALAAHVAEIFGELDRLDDAEARSNVLDIAYRVARGLAQNGLHEDAAMLLEQTLAASERILGPDHPSTLSVRANLASAYQEIGRREEAVALLEQTLAASERILGPDHPSTRTVRANLGYIRNRPEGSYA
jgi:tetratricopeptide (TPR) repeat protein